MAIVSVKANSEKKRLSLECRVHSLSLSERLAPWAQLVNLALTRTRLPAYVSLCSHFHVLSCALCTRFISHLLALRTNTASTRLLGEE
jgi:hypothetical protein